MEQNKYNGYTNYETWLCALHIDNCESSQDHVLELAREALEDSTPRYALQEALKSEFEEMLPEINNDFFTDLLNSAIQSINWYELADLYFEQLKELEVSNV